MQLDIGNEPKVFEHAATGLQMAGNCRFVMLHDEAPSSQWCTAVDADVQVEGAQNWPCFPPGYVLVVISCSHG
jgi:hypothetical protein